MLKALIIAGDSVSPDIIFQKPELFPTFTKMVQEGASASYSAYVQKGYHGSYSSGQNWVSIYTGLSPKEHGAAGCSADGTECFPRMKDFQELSPFWEVISKNGLKTGLWAADGCIDPVPIQGYVVSVDWPYIDTPAANRRAPCTLQIHEKDAHIRKYLAGNPPDRLYPKTLAQQGYTFSELQTNPVLAEKAAMEYHFQDSLENFEEELSYWFHAMVRVQKNNPVDVLYFYTPTPDLIAHCCMYCDDNPVLLKCYQLLDRYMGKLLAELKPETALFLSDHGQQNFKELVPSKDLEIQKKAFASREKALWLKNGSIAFEAHNGALLFTAHALKGTFIASGSRIRHTKAEGMRTLDIYPTFLEMMGVLIPENRTGYVADIFDGSILNEARLLPAVQNYISIALIQTQSVNIMDIIINELYIANRFAAITVVCEKEFQEIFAGNPRVKHSIAYEDFHMTDYDEIYCGIYYADSETAGHRKLKKEQKLTI